MYSPLRTTSNSYRLGKPWTSPLSGLIQKSSCVLFFSFSSDPSYIFSSFITISMIFFVSISASVCPSHYFDLAYLVFSRSFCLSVSLSFTLSSFSICWLVSIFCAYNDCCGKKKWEEEMRNSILVGVKCSQKIRPNMLTIAITHSLCSTKQGIKAINEIKQDISCFKPI